jgi:hypothetical protein
MGVFIRSSLYIILCAAAGLLIGCESSPYERRQTQAVRAPLSGTFSTDHEVMQDSSLGMSFLRVDGPRDKNDTFHVKPLGIDSWDFFPGKPEPEASLKPMEVPQGTINLQPTGTPPPAKP